MDNRQHQQIEHTKILIKGKNNNKEAHRQMAHFRVIAPTKKISVWSTKFKQTYKPKTNVYWKDGALVNICSLIWKEMELMELILKLFTNTYFCMSSTRM